MSGRVFVWKCFFAFAALTLTSAPVLAVDGELPLWFRILEPLGIIIGVCSVVLMYLNYKKFGGVIGKSYLVLLVSVAMFASALIFRSILESGLVEESLVTETIFELFIYSGMVLIVVSSYIAIRGFDRSINAIASRNKVKKK